MTRSKPILHETGGVLLLDRREFLNLAAASLAATVRPGAMAEDKAVPRFKAIAFDGFPIFDVRPVAALAETAFPGSGQGLVNVWRTRQFEYQWLRALGGHYADFRQATEDGLVFAARSLKLDLRPSARDTLMSAYSNLTVWPDVPSALGNLHKAGVRLVILSNVTERMLEDGVKRSGVDGLFEAVLSTDRIRTYKPDQRAYQMGMDALHLRREEILFAPFAGWDAAGAKWFGYPTFWVNRLGSPAEELGAVADGVGPDLDALVKFVLG
jgi:2-haloacid dehalogenase